VAYPTGLDELTDGVPSDVAAPTTALDDGTYPHDDHHRALGVAGEALETKVGIGASAAASAATNTVLTVTTPGTTAWTALPSATATSSGVAELATDAETITGTDTNRVITPANAKAAYQPLDTDLTAIGGLTSAADKVPYSTGAGTWALADLPSAGRTLIAYTTAALAFAGIKQDATEAATGVVELATTTEATTGTDTNRAITAAGAKAVMDAHNVAADPHTGYVLESLADAKGDIYTASGNDTPARLAVGTNGYTLVADSTQTTGQKWTAQPAVILSTSLASTSSTSLTVDTVNIHDVTLNTNTTFVFSSTAAVAQWTLVLREDNTNGSHTVSWPASVKWHSATAPTKLNNTNAVHVLEFLTVNSGTTWRGFLASSAVS
jgi:hypothetical protein